MARPGGLDVSIDGNLWVTDKAAGLFGNFTEETLPTGDEISTEKVTGTAVVRLPIIQTVLIRTEVITEDQIIMTEDPEIEEIETVEKSSVWLILGPTIASGILVLIAIFFVVNRIRKDRIRAL